jgi:hypothetical protein
MYCHTVFVVVYYNKHNGGNGMDDVSVVWDLEDDPDGNVQHIGENDLTIDEVEDVLLDPDNQDVISRSSGRPITFGWTSTDRHIAVVWEIANKDPRMIRVVTAYETPPKKRKGMP